MAFLFRSLVGAGWSISVPWFTTGFLFTHSLFAVRVSHSLVKGMDGEARQGKKCLSTPFVCLHLSLCSGF